MIFTFKWETGFPESLKSVLFFFNGLKYQRKDLPHISERRTEGEAGND